MMHQKMHIKIHHNMPGVNINPKIKHQNTHLSIGTAYTTMNIFTQLLKKFRVDREYTRPWGERTHVSGIF